MMPHSRTRRNSARTAARAPRAPGRDSPASPSVPPFRPCCIAIVPLDFERRRSNEQRARENGLCCRCRDCAIASSPARSAMRVGEFGGRHVIRVHVVDRAGDRGAQAVDRKARNAADAGDAGVNFAQLSALPTPSEVTTPMPVTAMTGRPALSRVASRLPLAICRSFIRPVRSAPALRRANCRRWSPTAWAKAAGLSPLSPLPAGANSLPCSMTAQAMPRLADELSIDPVSDIRAGIADGKPDLREHAQLRRRRRFEPAGAGNDGGAACGRRSGAIAFH